MTSKIYLFLAASIALVSTESPAQAAEPVAIERPTARVMKLRDDLFTTYEKEIEAFELGIFPTISAEMIATLSPELATLESEGDETLAKKILGDIQQDLAGIHSSVFYRCFRKEQNHNGAHMHSAEACLQYIDDRLHYVVRTLNAGNSPIR